jgi:hypothetical protein
MTFAEAAMIMMSGGSTPPAPSGPPTFPSGLTYYNYSTTISDTEYNGSEYINGETREVPADSLVITYYITWTTGDGKNAYAYRYRIWQLIIDDVDTADEEVVGIIDKDNNKTYRFQFNTKGGR